MPVVLAVYAGTFGTRVWLALRPAIATFLGATVIGSVYADAALKRAPATPMRAAAVLALAIALVGTGMAPAPAFAGSDPLENVIAAARSYLGTPYKLGAEGPDKFDCSGLMFRIFSDAGELPRIGGRRLLARGYMRHFVSRGLFTKDIDKAKRGDLVVWGMGEHIGIYLGDNKAISAVLNPWGVTLHGVNWVPLRADYFLQVDYGNGNGNDDPGDGNGNDDPGDGEPGDGNGDDPGTGPSDPPPGDGGEGENPTDPPPGDGGEGENPTDPPGDGGEGNPADGGNGTGGDDKGSSDNGVGKDANEYGPPAQPTDPPTDPPSDPPTDPPSDPPTDDPGKDGNGQPEPDQPAPDSAKGLATGTMNVRHSPDPSARIVGWVSRGTTFRILGSGNSPSGYRWYKIETTSGNQGWVFGHWVREL